MLSTALAFADLDGKVCNNTSVVLLIEWKGKRLLFVGDAEWDAAFKEGKGNCSWNVMWNLRKERIKGPLAFYKIGHHGSVNATPWGMTPAASKGEPLAILDAILPLKSKAKAKAIVSTRRGNLPDDPAHRSPRRDRDARCPIPGTTPTRSKGRQKDFQTCRCSTIRKKKSFAKPQPLRTGSRANAGRSSHRLRRRRNRSVIADNGPFLRQRDRRLRPRHSRLRHSPTINLENPNPECDYTPLVAKEEKIRTAIQQLLGLRRPQHDVRPGACAESPRNRGAQPVGLK